MQRHQILGLDQLIVLNRGIEPEALHVQSEVVAQLLFLPDSVGAQQEVFVVLLPVHAPGRKVVILRDFELHSNILFIIMIKIHNKQNKLK